MYAREIHHVAHSCIPAAAEFEPVGNDCSAAVNGPIGGDPQGFPLGTLRRRAEGSQICELPWDQPRIWPVRAVQAAGQPVCAGGAEGAVSVVDNPGHISSHPSSTLSVAALAETYVHVACPRSA